MGSLPILSLTDVPEKSAECLAAEASLYMKTLCHQCNGLILLIRGRTTRTDLWIASHDVLWGCARALWKYLKGPLLPLTYEGKIVF